jgi:hypothetical protein
MKSWLILQKGDASLEHKKIHEITHNGGIILEDFFLIFVAILFEKQKIEKV